MAVTGDQPVGVRPLPDPVWRQQAVLPHQPPHDVSIRPEVRGGGEGLPRKPLRNRQPSDSMVEIGGRVLRDAA